MRTADLQKKTAKELQAMLQEERTRLQRLKFELSAGKVKNVREVRRIRRGIARILTFLRQAQ